MMWFENIVIHSNYWCSMFRIGYVYVVYIKLFVVLLYIICSDMNHSFKAKLF